MPEAEPVDFTPTSSDGAGGALAVAWIHGSVSAKHNTDPDIQIHWYDAHTVVLRQNKAIDYEAPFLFLLFGNARAVLFDTGATEDPAFFPLRATVDDLVARWLAAHPRQGYELVVLHTHSHADHTAADPQFHGRSDTTVVPAGRDEAYSYLGLTDDVEVITQLDLGGRAVHCIASPGHDAAAVTFYDGYTGLLLTGDTLYPGRLFVRDWPAYVATVDRLLRFAEDHPVRHVVGCHIEMTTRPGEDYPIRITYQPDEPPLEMSVDRLRDLQRAVAEIAGQPGRHVHPDFIVHVLDPDNPGLG